MSHSGSCLCGDVAFDVIENLAPVVACHCGQCRKQTGSAWLNIDVQDTDLTLRKDTGLKWFTSSPGIKRGFCGTCGSLLFWKVDGDSDLAVSAGAFDNPTGTRLAQHIWCAHKGDFYEIADDLPQRSEY